MQQLKYWLGIGIRCWQRVVSGGDPPKFGRVVAKEEQERKTVRKCKKLGIEPRFGLHQKAAEQARIRRKALSGPQEHEVFEAWDRDHPIVELFDVPNLLDCSYDLWSYTTMFYLLNGWANWWVMRNEYGVPVELWPIPTHWMRLVTGRDGMPEAYAIQSPWGTLQYAPYDDVLSFYDHSPLDRYEGYSVPLLISEWLDAYDASVRSRLSQNYNGAIPAFHVALSDEYVDPDEAMLNRLYAKWFARFQGPDRAGLPLITGPGVEVKSLGITPVEMDYVNSENQYRDMMLAALGVPKAVVGIEAAQESQYAAHNQFTEFVINPFLTMLGQRTTHGLIRRTPNCQDGVCFWDTRKADNPESRRADIQVRAANRAITPNMIMTEFGEEPFPFGGDNPIDPATGQELPWATGGQQPEHAQLDAAFQRAAGRRLAVSNDPDEPMIVDKDETEPAGPNLRWYRTRDGHLSSRGKNGTKWYIERTPNGYLLKRDDEHFDADRAVGLLKQVAEDEETKALGGSSGAAGGYAMPVDRNFGQRMVPYSDASGRADFAIGSLTPPPEGVSIESRRKLNDEIDQILGRASNPSRKWFMGNGASTNGKH